MANRRVLVKRRQASRNIRKITRTMQLIATARFQGAYAAAMAGRPYTDKLAELVRSLARGAEGIDHPLLQVPDEESRAAIVVLTSNRGLCGGYNANVLRHVIERVEALKEAGVEPELHVVGKKGINYLKFLRHELASELTDIGDSPRFDEVEPIAVELIDRFIGGEIQAVEVAYTQFISTARQRAVVERLLPLAGIDSDETGEEETGDVDFEFSPEPKLLLDELLPATVKVRLFQGFTDAVVSEQVARMVAMKAATDAAEEMIKRLTQQYNRARQTQITMELLDIVGGANALE